MSTDPRIRKETFCKIAEIALTHSRTTRAQLAELAGVSSMTAGRAADILLGMGALESSRAEHSRGRHAELLHPSERIRYLMLDMTDTECCALVTNAGGDVICSMQKRVSDALTLEDNIEIMQRSMRELADLGDSFAVGAVTRGRRTRARDTFGADVVVAGTELLRQRLALTHSAKNVLYVRVSDTLRSAFFSRWGAIDGDRVVFPGNSSVQLCERIEDLFAGISELCRVHTVIVESSNAVFDASVGEMLRRSQSLCGCEVLFYENMSFTASCMLDVMSHRYAEMLSERI